MLNTHLSKFILSAFWLLLLTGTSLCAQQAFDLKDCFKIAELNNIQLRQLKLNESISTVDLKQSKDNFLPTFNGNTSYNYALSQSRNFETNDIFVQRSHALSLGLGVNASIFEGFARKIRVSSSELNLDVAELETAVFRNNLQLSIFSSYLEILRAEEQIRIVEQQDKLLQDQYERTEKLIAAGVIPKGDIAELSSQIAQQNASKITAENALEISMLNLSQQLNYDEDFTLEKPEDLPVPSTEDYKNFSVEKIFSDALGTRPEIQANELRLSIAEYGLKEVDARRLPTVSFNSSMGTSYRKVKFPPSEASFFNVFTISESTLPRQFAENFSWGLGATANIPIFNQWQVKNGKQRALLGIEAQKVSNESTEIELYNAIQQAYLSARSNALNFEASQIALESAQTAYDIIQKKYNYGTATLLEVNTALNNLTINQLNNNNARFAYIFSIKIMEFYAGKPLSL